MKNKKVAALLAFFAGIFGAHKFYLKDNGAGIFLLVLWFMCSTLGGILDTPLMFIPFIIALLDGIKLLKMPDQAFDDKYNPLEKQKPRKPKQRKTSRVRVEPEVPKKNKRIPVKASALRKKGIALFKDFEYQNAILVFEESLEIYEKDLATHFNAACCYSLMENKKKAFYHLDKAVEYGLKNTSRINSHDALSFLRTSEEFLVFKENGFRLPQKVQIEETKENDLSQKDYSYLLDQIKELSLLKERGDISEEEFEVLKRNIMK